MDIFNQLKENPKNPRTINKLEFERLVNSLRTFPKMLELRPIVYDKDFVVVGGNMRLKALKELVNTENFEIKDTYFRSAESLTEEEIRMFVIRDNVSDGRWDTDLLTNNWNEAELKEWGIDLEKWSGINAESEWEGMPEFNNEDKTAYKQIIVSFKNEDDMNAFAKLIEQYITLKTKSIWYPKQENESVADKEYMEEVQSA